MNQIGCNMTDELLNRIKTIVSTLFSSTKENSQGDASLGG